MKTIHIETTWKSIDAVEVPDDFDLGGTLDDEWADQVDANGAYLTDWREI